MFLALALVLPLLTGQIKSVGSMLLPMHIPVMFCGLLCGWQYGGIVGFAAPLLRNLIFAMPPMPNAVSMAFELAVYGLVTGLLFNRFRNKNIVSLYLSMIVSMLLGRGVWGVVQAAILGIKGTGFTFKMFIASAFTNAIPGIILQLVLIPAIMVSLKFVRIGSKKETNK